ncbi:LytR/AlgR family response regulator transcription factor [Flexithrix dorotheae]|uniref:LytR/AlgR family response regulator transcription factor n=1 Tax=Flexithrix dorotheae TaxID=70993 RepID=UPI00037CAD50|nr:LytTR family DNA-binding domain-containing protein [Flexithrix dorotheae]
MISCICIDKDPVALRSVKSFIERTSYLNLLGSFENYYEAYALLETQKPDLLFLDLNIPELREIDFLKSLNNPPKVIFTTGYSQFALHAFELNAVDFLLKPFSYERFLKATDKIFEIHQLEQFYRKEKNSSIEDYILIKSEHNIIKIDLKEIYYIEGYKDYLKIYTTKEKPILTLKSLKAMEEILARKGFIRVHKSFLISIQKIESMRNNKIRILNKYIPLGENYKKRFHFEVVEGRC